MTKTDNTTRPPSLYIRGKKVRDHFDFVPLAQLAATSSTCVLGIGGFGSVELLRVGGLP